MADPYGLLLEDLLRGRSPRVPQAFNPDHFLWRAGEHGLYGVTYEAMSRVDVSLPEELRAVMNRLKGLTQAQEAVVRYRLAAARALAAGLALRGIPALFIKGVALAVEAYDAPGLRTFADLDLLVVPEDREAALGAVGDLGYREDTAASPSGMELHLWSSSDAGPGIGLDLHWACSDPWGSQSAVRIPVAELVARRHETEGLPVPAPEDSLLVCAANLVRSRVDRLVLVVDFDRLVRGGVDWSAVLSRASAWRLRTALWLGLQLAVRLAGTEVPERVLLDLRPAAWRVAVLCRLLEGSFLWMRRKFKRPLLSGALAYLCLDSVGDGLRGLDGSRNRVLRNVLTRG